MHSLDDIELVQISPALLEVGNDFVDVSLRQISSVSNCGVEKLAHGGDFVACEDET